MPNPFVWFDNLSAAQSETAHFLKSMFAWDQQQLGPMIAQAEGATLPFAGVCPTLEGRTGWIPYVEVQDLAGESRRAKAAGARIIAENLDGPAGYATFIEDPGGAVMALWTRKGEA